MQRSHLRGAHSAYEKSVYLLEEAVVFFRVANIDALDRRRAQVSHRERLGHSSIKYPKKASKAGLQALSGPHR